MDLLTRAEGNVPVVFLIGTLDSEGVLSSLKAAGRSYAVRRIDSTVKNWESICDQIEQEQIDCIVLKLTGTTYYHLADETYREVRERFLEHVARSRHMIFAYEDLLSGGTSAADEQAEQAEDDGFIPEKYFDVPLEEQRLRVNAMLAERGLRVTPYRKNAEVTTLASAFIAQVEHGLLFRVYIPAHRLWASETDRMLVLFRDYLSNVGHRNVTLNQRRTAQGIIYEFFSAESDGQGPTPSVGLAVEFSEFSRLLDLCLTDTSKAEQLLRDKRVDPREIEAVLSRFSKEAKRLQVDLRQERERKVLSIRHRLEAELSEILPPDFDLHNIGRLVDAVVPTVERLGVALTGGQLPTQLTANAGGSIVVNVSPQIVHSVNAIVAREITGDVHLSSEDQHILQLIRTHAPDREVELSSAVRELADASVPKAERMSAKQRLKAFLFQLAGKIPDVAAGLLQSYLEGRFGG